MSTSTHHSETQCASSTTTEDNCEWPENMEINSAFRNLSGETKRTCNMNINSLEDRSRDFDKKRRSTKEFENKLLDATGTNYSNFFNARPKKTSALSADENPSTLKVEMVNSPYFCCFWNTKFYLLND